MARQIFLFETEGRTALGFDTGLDARAFAQARFARFMTEPGFTVYPDGAVEPWTAAGVIERETMIIWGPAFEGDSLDSIIAGNTQRDRALDAVVRWIRARLFLEDRPAPLLPCAAMLACRGSSHPAGTVFFSPESLVQCCMQAAAAEERMSGGEWYVHPDSAGTQAAAFTASAMLYRIFAGTAPFSALDTAALRQDMREGNYTPLRLAVPGIDSRLAALTGSALRPAAGPDGPRNGADCLNRFLEILSPPSENAAPAADTFIRPLPEKDRASLVKEKEQTVKRNNRAVKTRRFVMRNFAIIAGSLAAAAAAVIIGYSVVQSRAALPTTAGMDSRQVAAAYYRAIGELDHQLMDACVAGGAGKNDINMVAQFFVISRMRQAYEPGTAPLLLSAEQWQAAGGGPVDAQVFGVSGLSIEPLNGEDASGEARYRAAYTLYLPRQGEAEDGNGRLPEAFHHIDELILTRKRGIWRITGLRRRTD
ncbi:MAG: hypothetical protein LBD48_09605 [Treponema sp.]|jgi:hypothetical protein|nr:hypothetical protein [Treponema sp.]